MAVAPPQDAVDATTEYLDTLASKMEADQRKGRTPDFSGYTLDAITKPEHRFCAPIGRDEPLYWNDSNGRVMVHAGPQFRLRTRSTSRLAGVTWHGHSTGKMRSGPVDSCKWKLPTYKGMRYTERGVTKATHGDMVTYGMQGSPQGMHGAHIIHPWNPSNEAMDPEIEELFKEHAIDFATILEEHAPELAAMQKRIMVNANATDYCLDDTCYAMSFAISISYVASPHQDTHEILLSAILFVCRERVDDWAFQAGPYPIMLPNEPGMARLVILDSVRVWHGTLASMNPDGSVRDHSNVGSVLLMDHNMMQAISKEKMEQKRTTIAGFVPGYESIQGTVPQILLQRVMALITDKSQNVFQFGINHIPTFKLFSTPTGFADALASRPTGLVFDCGNDYLQILRDYPELMHECQWVFLARGNTSHHKQVRIFLENWGMHPIFDNGKYEVWVSAQHLDMEALNATPSPTARGTNAAVTIQSVFRGMRARRETRSEAQQPSTQPTTQPTFKTIRAFAPGYWNGSRFVAPGTILDGRVDEFELYDADGTTLVKNLGKEASEQVIVRRALDLLTTDRELTIVEFGGNIGRNAIQILLWLVKKGRGILHVFEPRRELCKVLRKNVAYVMAARGYPQEERNALIARHLVVHEGALADGPLFMEKFDPTACLKSKTFRERRSESDVEINCITDFDVRPDVVVFDCEGAAPSILSANGGKIGTIEMPNHGMVYDGWINHFTKQPLIPLVMMPCESTPYGSTDRMVIVNSIVPYEPGKRERRGRGSRVAARPVRVGG